MCLIIWKAQVQNRLVQSKQRKKTKEIIVLTTDLYYSILLLNQNKSGKLNTFKRANFLTTDIYLRRLLPKSHEQIFWFALPTDQLLYNRVSLTEWRDLDTLDAKVHFIV